MPASGDLLMLPHAAPLSHAWLALCWLTSWRVTTMICYEAGPFDIFSWLRTLLARIGLQRLVTCFYCANVWVSAATVLLVYEPHVRSLLLILGISGAVSITERVLGGNDV